MKQNITADNNSFEDRLQILEEEVSSLRKDIEE